MRVPAADRASNEPLAGSLRSMSRTIWNTIWGKDSEWFWIMCQSLALLVTLLWLSRQAKSMREANMLQALVPLEERWKSELLLSCRAAAAKRHADGRCDIGRREGEVLSFFESLGVYLQRKIFDREILWEKYSYFIEHYWLIFSEHIAHTRSSTNDVSWSDQFEYLNHEMLRCAQKRKIGNYGKKTPEEIAKFVAGEVDRALS